MTITYSPAIRALMEMDADMVSAKHIAPVLGAKPEALIKKVKEGKWDINVCNVFQSGNRVKFYRIDFLRKGGWIQ